MLAGEESSPGWGEGQVTMCQPARKNGQWQNVPLTRPGRLEAGPGSAGMETQTSEKGPWQSVQCTDWHRAGGSVVELVLSCKAQYLYFVPRPFTLTYGCAMTVFFLFCPSFWAVFFFFVVVVVVVLLFRATPEAYGSSRARGGIRAVAAGLHHSQSNVGSEPHL